METAFAFSQEREMDLALEYIEKAIEIAPNEPELIYFRGSAKFFIGDDEGAIEDLDRVIAQNRHHGLAYVYRGAAKSALGMHWEGIKDLNTAIRIDPKNPLAYFHRAMAYQYNREGEIFGPGAELLKAISDFDWAIKLQPRNADYWYLRGRAKAHCAGFKQEIVLSDYEKALEIDPKFAKAHFGIGTYMAEKGDFPKAIEELTKSIELDPNFALGYSNRAMAKKLSGDYHGALADFDRAVEIEPENGLFWFNRGSLKGCIDEIPYEEQVGDLDVAIKLCPDEPEIYYIRGISKRDFQRFAEAIEDFEKELEFRQDNPKTYYYLANCKGKVAKYTAEERLRNYDMAIELGCDIPECYVERGFLRHKIGDYPGAIKDAYQYIDLCPQSLKGYELAICVDYDVGNPDGALKLIEKALSIDPNYEFGLKVKKLILDERARLTKYPLWEVPPGK